eukprot:TRINITY_DN20202_c0_g1_i1.p1 TRINITY_DN20202_c0_g1~~TRINITY_DN20202_c0_g1_i1.p1  ORF type:complete len:270 (-),score=80.91 TRINITY_DN20202_c0_g1_i1:73-882(-)
MVFERKLRALEYPNSSTFDITKMEQVQALVSWLEDMKIRSLKIEERDNLRKYDNNWINTFQKYVDELGYGKKVDEKNLEGPINYLLAHAISLEYSDNRDDINKRSQKHQTQTQVQNVLSDRMQQDLSTNATDPFNTLEFKQELQKLTKLFNLPPNDDTTVVLKTLAHLIQRRFSVRTGGAAQIVDLSKKSQSNSLSNDKPNWMTALEEGAFPLGFETRDKDLDKAATILRILYVSDLKELQTEINELIVAVQNFTADPKAQSSLGKVGR